MSDKKLFKHMIEERISDKEIIRTNILNNKINKKKNILKIIHFN